MMIVSGCIIQSELHSGEKSVVYRAFKGDEPVILKTLQDEYPSVSELNAFRQEYEILEKIQNSTGDSSKSSLGGVSSVSSVSVVRTLGLEKYKNSYVIVFEDIGAEALSHILPEIRKFPFSEILNLMIKAAKALGEVHKLGLVHKDIKPHNIIFNKQTGRLQIIDFGNASYLRKQNAYTPLNSSLEGTLAYISPEQTGRMNRTVDYRTDYYSLGVTFYQLLTGELPFNSKDPMELVHAHIAKIPTPPKDSGLQPTEQRVVDPLSKVISDIVMKLLQKNPEDRYQSIAGLVYDLELCLNHINAVVVGDAYMRHLQQRGDDFRIGQNDFSGKFQIPEKLYGREQEIKQILETFKEMVGDNSVETLRATSLRNGVSLHIISGRSGIGKSALINEINKPITQYKGYFASGKYDQYKRSIPFSAITSAFQNLIQQVLANGQEEISIWKENLLAAVGANGKVIIDMIPELETLIGEQPAIAELGSTESQNRFNLVFQNFIQSFCAKEHPIAIFLDDLQWADTPSIKLIQTILSNPEMKYLYLMLSFRDNEVLPTGPFSIMLEDLKKAGFTYKEILLEPISISDITHLVSDTLSCEKTKAIELAEILFGKTKGNPFFVSELFKSLYDRDLIWYTENAWTWEISKIREEKISENVVDLMVAKVKELSSNQIELLKLAACVGDSFQIDTFLGLTNQSVEEVTQELTVISNEGFLIFTKEVVRFVHDKVREATYSLISENEKVSYHYKIGKFLLANTPSDLLEDRIFNILGQLNLGKSLIHSFDEQIELIQLNLKAGKKAKASTAYEAASNFLKYGIELLSDNKWETHYRLCLEIYKELAECEYLLTHFARADKLFDYILENAKTVSDKIPIIHIQLRQKASEYKGDEAFQIGFKILERLGLKMPDLTKPETITAMFIEQLGEYKQLLGDKAIPSLFDLPTMTNPNILEAISLITNLGDIAIAMKQEMLGLMSIMGVTLSLKYGNTNVSPISYVMWGVINNLGFKDFQSGYELGQLGLKLNQEKFPSDLIFAKAYAFYGWNIHHYKHHTKYDLEIAKKGYETAMANSDLVYAMYFVAMPLKVAFNIGLSLDEVLEYGKRVQLFADKYKTIFATMIGNPTTMAALALQGKTESPTSLNNPNYSEEEYLNNFSTFGQSTVYFYLRKFQLCYLFGEYDKALALLLDVKKYFPNLPAHIAYAEYFFYKALLFLAIPPSFVEEEKKQMSDEFIEAHGLLKLWSGLCEDNFEHQLLLVEAEKARVEGRDLEAMQLYKKAINSARKYEYINNAAIANELAANYYLSKGLEEVAAVYIYEAQYLYKIWGAVAKVKQLEEKYPQLRKTSFRTSDASLKSIPHLTDNSIVNTKIASSGNLDIHTILKASQAISGEIQLEKLLEKMMQILLENAGAERGFFLLKEKGKWCIQAEGNSNSNRIEVLKSKSLEDNSDLPKGIANYVIRTKNLVLLDDAAKKGMFINDEYVKRKLPKSILCYPVFYRGEIAGVIYLENNISSNIFTPDRLEVLQFLSSQIAISVENSLLYANLEQKVLERTSQVNEMLAQLGRLYIDSENKRKEIELLAESRKKLSLVGQMAAGIVHDIKNPMASIKYLAETLNAEDTSDESKAENLSLILREMDRLTDLTYEILDFSKGQLNLDLQEISLGEFFTDIKNFLTLDFDYMGVQCLLDLRYTGSIQMDKDRMRRVIVNIAKNAIEAMYDKKKEYALIIRTFQEADKIVFSLIDNGPGLPESVKANMFQAFATEGKTKGTGLGLFMCKWIVDTHGGQLTYETETGKGTSFHILLPTK